MRFHFLLRVLSLVFASVLPALPVRAQVVWTGNGANNNWSTTANWQGSAAPANNGTATVQLAGGTRLQPAVGSAWSLAGLAFNSGAGAFSLSGSTLTLGSGGLANSSASNQTIANAFTLSASQTWRTTSTGDLIVSGAVSTGSFGLTLQAATGTTISLSGVVSGGGSLTKSGTGTAVLTSDNTFSGGTTVSAGTLQLGNGGTSGMISNNSSGASVNLATGAILAINRSDNLTFNPQLLGEGTLALLGSGEVSLVNTNSFFRGAVQLDAGTLVLDSGKDSWPLGDAGPNAAHPLTGNGGTLRLNEVSMTLLRHVTVAAGGLTLAIPEFSTFTLGGDLSGSGSLTKTGGGLWVIAGGGTFDGVTRLQGGSIQLYNNDGLRYSTLELTSGTLWSSSGALITLGGLSGTGGLTLNSPLSIGANHQDTTYSGILGGNGLFSKIGNGSLTLQSASTRTGENVLEAGALLLGHNSALGSGPLTISGGALAASGGARTLANAVTLSGSATLGGSQPLTLSGGVTLASNLVLTVTNTALTTLSGTLGESGASRALHKAGAGTLVLSGANTYSGGTLLAGGTLAIAGNATLGTGPLTFAGGTLEASGTARTVTNSASFTAPTTFASSHALTFAGATTFATNADLTINGSALVTLAGPIGESGGSRGLTKSGAGTLVLAGSNTFTGPTSVSAGLLRLAHPQALQSSTLTSGGVSFGSLTTATLGSLSGNFTLGLYNDVGASVALTVGANNATTTFSGDLWGTGALTKTGTGVLTLAGESPLGGFVSVTGGTLRLAHSHALQNATLISTGVSFGTLSEVRLGGLMGGFNLPLTNTNNQPVTLVVGGNSFTSTYGGTLSGAGTLQKVGSGTLAIYGNVQHTGGTIITQGTLEIGAGLSTGSISGEINVGSAGVLAFNRPGLITHTGQIKGEGTVVIAGYYGYVMLSGANEYTGQTRLDSNQLVLGHDSALGTSRLVLNGGSLSTFATRTLANSVSLVADTTIVANAAITSTGNWTLDRNRDLTIEGSQGVTITGVISGSGRGLSKLGPGKLTLTGANTYNGGTFIGAGTIVINNATGSAFGSGAVTIATGATLTGAGSFSGALQNNGTYAPGNSPALVTLSSFTQSAAGILTLELSGLARGTEFDALNITGALTFGGTLQVTLLDGFSPTSGQSFDLFDWGSASGTFSTLSLPTLGSGFAWDTAALYSSGTLAVITTPIAEPATYAALAGLGAFALAAWRSRRCTKKACRL